MNGPIVTLFGSSSPRPGEAAYVQALEIGRALGSAGYAVCNGGYDGTMEAAHRGAKEAGGRTIGVTCAVFSDYRGFALQRNPYVDEEIRIDNVFGRIERMMQLGEAYVVLPGGTGTLCELGIVWEFVAKGLIRPRPICVVGDFWLGLVEAVGSLHERHRRFVHRADTADAVIRCLDEHLPASRAAAS